MGKEYLNQRQMSKYFDAIQEQMKTCKCGHRVFVENKYKYRICTWCGSRVYKDEREKFKDILERRLKYGK